MRGSQSQWICIRLIIDFMPTLHCYLARASNVVKLLQTASLDL